MPSPRWAFEASRLIARGPVHTSHQLQLLHIFRAQLRECTYLPDPQARVYMKAYVLDRWRAYSPKPQSTIEYTRPLLSSPTVRFSRMRKIANKGLSQLRRANDGHLRPLFGVLLMTYGRMGKRRHELLRPLMAPEPEKQSTEDGDILRRPDFIARRLENLGDLPATTVEKLPKLSSSLEALLHSHTRTVLPSDTRPRLKRLELNLPAQNSWMLPTPQSRIINAVKRWYAATLHRTLPPLPEDEWNRLRRLSCGEQRWDGAIPRRPKGSIVDLAAAQEEVDVIGDISPELQQQLGITHVTRHVLRTRSHHMKHRFMRRMWMRVFLMCPLMIWDVQRNKWDIRWGGPRAVGTDGLQKPRKPTVLLKVFEMHGFGLPSKVPREVKTKNSPERMS